MAIATLPLPPSATIRDSSSLGGASGSGSGDFPPAGGRTRKRPASRSVSSPAAPLESFPHLTDRALPTTRGVAGARTPCSVRRSRRTFGDGSLGMEPTSSFGEDGDDGAAGPFCAAPAQPSSIERRSTEQRERMSIGWL